MPTVGSRTHYQQREDEKNMHLLRGLQCACSSMQKTSQPSDIKTWFISVNCKHVAGVYLSFFQLLLAIFPEVKIWHKLNLLRNISVLKYAVICSLVGIRLDQQTWRACCKALQFLQPVTQNGNWIKVRLAYRKTS